MSRVFIGNSTTLQTWKQAYNGLDSDVGSRTALTTVDKSSFSNAMNEHQYRIDSIDALVDQAVLITSEVVFNGLTLTDSSLTHHIAGSIDLQKDLTVRGYVNFINSTQVDIGDNIIVLNADVVGTPTQNSGVEVERGTDINAFIRWNEGGDYWDATNDGIATTGRIITDADIGTLIDQNIALATIANNKLVNPYITFKDSANNNSNIALGDTLTINGTLQEATVDYNAGTYTVGLPADVTITNNLIVGNNFSVGGNFTIVGNSLHASPLIRLMAGNIASGLGVNVEYRSGLHIDRGQLSNILFVYDENVSQFVWYDSDNSLAADKRTLLTTHNTVGTVDEVEVTYSSAGTTIGLPTDIVVAGNVTASGSLITATHTSPSNFTSTITGNYGLSATGTTTVTSGGNFEADVTGTVLVKSTSDTTIDAGSKIILDADSGRVTIKDNAITTLDIIANGIIDVTFDAPGDIILDADGANVTLKDNGITALDILWNGTSAASVVTLDAPGHINLDADGGQIRMLDGGVEFARFTKSSNGVTIQGGNTKSYMSMIDSAFVIVGDLIVRGTTTYTNVTEVSTADNIITLNADVTAIATENAGIEVERGTAANAFMRWNEAGDYWEATNDNLATPGRVITTADAGTITASMMAVGAITGSTLSGGYITVNSAQWDLATTVALDTDFIVEQVGAAQRFYSASLARGDFSVANSVNTTTDGTNKGNAYLEYDGANGVYTLKSNPVPTGTGVISVSADREISHGTVTAVSANLSNGYVIQDVGIDTHGHVTSFGSVNLDNRFLRLDNNTIKTSGYLKLNDNLDARFGTDNDYKIYHSGAHAYHDLSTGNTYFRDGTTTRFTFARTTGDFTASGNITAYSDERLKSNIRTIDNALDKVSELRGVYFDKDDKASTGVIAQEIEKVLPEVVNNDGEYKSVAYGNIVGILIEAIKELKAEIETLKSK